jgi:hypothetical protein
MNVGNVLSAIKTLEAARKALNAQEPRDALVIKRVDREIERLQHEIDCIQLTNT